ncbi:DUF3630 family protein [Colwelliaceae bacterium BS250]|uniref:DUF3630 family protein n=1 Tax=Moritella sp. TaxID=78556 RepID=UPI0029A14F51|nr:DUF3630 family protein [Moritella sp.]MDX2319534.1 DUF3630 family protein [Moritella sp.]
MQQINKVDLENNNLLLITFKQMWDQDDISDLSELIFSQFDGARIIEAVTGADRQYYRFNYHNEYLILHFESYSNACWLEPEDQQSSEKIADIGRYLQHNII